MAHNHFYHSRWKKRARIAVLSALGLSLLQSPVGTAFASSGSTTQSSSTVYSASDTEAIANLANLMVSLAAKINSPAISPIATPILKMTSQPGFSWNVVLFGTTTLTPNQAQTSAALSGDIQALATFSATDTTTATALIHSVITAMQGLNPSITPADVVNFLQAIESQAVVTVLPLASQPNLQPADVAMALHTAVAAALAGSATPAIQALFAAASTGGTGGTGSGGSAGGAGASGSTGSSGSTSSGGSTGSGSSSGSSSGTTSSGSSGSGNSSSGTSGTDNSTGSGTGSSANGSNGGSNGTGTGTGTGSGAGVAGNSSAGGTASGSASQNAAIAGMAMTVAMQTVDSSSATISGHTGDVTMELSIPLHAFRTPEQVTLTTTNPADIASLLKAHLPSGYQASLVIGVQFSGDPPAAPVTLTVSASGLTGTVQVFKVTATGLVPVNSTLANGQLSIAFSSDPQFVIATRHIKQTTTKARADGTYKESIFKGKKRIAITPVLVKDGASFVPVWYAQYVLRDLGFKTQLNNTAWKITAPRHAVVDLSKLKFKGGNLPVYLNAHLVDRMDVMKATNPRNNKPADYIPVNDIVQILQHAGVKNEFTTAKWQLNG